MNILLFLNGFLPKIHGITFRVKYILDCLKNGGIADYSISYLHALPGIFSNISSPNEIAQLIIPEYSLLDPSGIIISEKDICGKIPPIIFW